MTQLYTCKVCGVEIPMIYRSSYTPYCPEHQTSHARAITLPPEPPWTTHVPFACALSRLVVEPGRVRFEYD